MKRFTHLLAALVFCSLMIFISCKKGGNTPPPDDPRDEQGEKLSGTWSLVSAKKDGADREEWDGFSLTVTYNASTDVGTYTPSGVPDNLGASDVFGENGASTSWEFAGSTENPSINTIVVDGDEIVVSVSATSLTLTFTVTDAEARTAGFNGEWVFTLEK